MEWITHESSPVYKQYVELLSNGVTAFNVKDKQLSVGSALITLPTYIDVDQSLATLYQERRALTLEYTFLCKQIIYGQRGVDLKERYDFCIKRLNILNKEISRLESYKELLAQKREAVLAKLDNKRDELVLTLKSSKSPKEYLKAHAKLNALYAKIRRLHQVPNHKAITKLPVIHGEVVSEVPEQQKVQKVHKRKRKEKKVLVGGSSTTLIDRVKSILKHRFGMVV